MWSFWGSYLAFLPLLSVLFRSAAAVSFDCKKVLAGGVEFKLETLGGYHQVSWIREGLGSEHNTTFKINICDPLELDDPVEKDECSHGTHICGIETLRRGDQTFKDGAYPIMRNYIHEHAEFNPVYTRLKDSASNTDSQKEGLRLEIGGGVKKTGQDKRPQRAVIEFICRKDEDAESDAEGSDEDEDDNGERKRPEWEAAKKTDDGAGGELEFLSYDQDSSRNEDTLRLNWYTPHGCEDAASSGRDTSSSGGWGFFSWFFFIIFMGLLVFIIFTAWINYTRNGARGWDLLPYSDIIRDVPYILGDWGRKIVSTLNGGGARGGYSAV